MYLLNIISASPITIIFITLWSNFSSKSAIFWTRKTPFSGTSLLNTVRHLSQSVSPVLFIMSAKNLREGGLIPRHWFPFVTLIYNHNQFKYTIYNCFFLFYFIFNTVLSLKIWIRFSNFVVEGKVWYLPILTTTTTLSHTTCTTWTTCITCTNCTTFTTRK